MTGQRVGNTNYVVISEIHVDEATLVIGHNKSLPENGLTTPYATWEANKEMTDFYWGHYFKDLYSAERDLVSRGASKVQFYDRLHGIKPPSKRDTR